MRVCCFRSEFCKIRALNSTSEFRNRLPKTLDPKNENLKVPKP
jgi:hypothetical protein